MSDSPHAVVSERRQIITVTFNRPEKLNPVSPEVTSVLWQAVEALGSRPDLRALVITGTGRYFTAGLDMVVGHGDRLPGPDALGSDWRRGYRSHALLYDEIEAIEKPVIVAANGPSLGAGLEMAVSCDFRFCTPETIWGLPETRSTGSIPGSGGVSRLTRLVGTHWTKWMAWAGRTITAEQALSMGLVHEIYPADVLMDRVYEFVDSLIAIDSEVSSLAKLTIDLCDPQDREKVRHIERLANTDLSHRGFGNPSSDYAGPAFKGRPGGARSN